MIVEFHYVLTFSHHSKLKVVRYSLNSFSRTSFAQSDIVAPGAEVWSKHRQEIGEIPAHRAASTCKLSAAILGLQY